MRRFFTLICAAGMLAGCQQGTPAQEKLDLPIRDGPLGLAMGQDPKDVGAVPMEGQPGWYKVPVAPKPHPVLVELRVFAGPSTGICEIIATGRRYENDDLGTQVQPDLERLRADLASKYGQPKKLDICDITPSRCLGLTYLEQLIALKIIDTYTWSELEGIEMPETLDRIRLVPSVDDQARTFAELQIVFKNWKDCEEDVAKMGARSL